MDLESLESRAKFIDHKTVQLSVEDYDHLLGQAYWANHFTKKVGELQEFLQNRVHGRAGDNVIDIVIDHATFLEKELQKNKCE